MIKALDCNPRFAGLIPAPISILRKARPLASSTVLKTAGPKNPSAFDSLAFRHFKEGCQRGLMSPVANRVDVKVPKVRILHLPPSSLRFSKAVMHDPVKVATGGSNPPASAIFISESSNGRMMRSERIRRGSNPRSETI